jgi:ribosomal protein S6-L-glutamate ligase RimK-like protein
MSFTSLFRYPSTTATKKIQAAPISRPAQTSNLNLPSENHNDDEENDPSNKKELTGSDQPYIKDPNFKGIYSCIGWNGGKLAYLLGCSVVFPYRKNVDTRHDWTQDKIRDGKLPRPINLGCRKKFISPNSLNYNSQFTRDKIAVFNKFDEAGIPHPRVVTLEQLSSNAPNLPKAILGRENKTSQGRGIEIYHSIEEWRRKFPKGRGTIKGEQAHDFYVELLDCKSEHRMHVFQGQIVCELNKRIKPGTIIHNCSLGSPLIFGRITHPQRNLMEEYSIKAVQACGLDFGAVDIFVDKNDKVYILEVNSDPGMPDGIGYLYAQRIRCIFGMEPLYNYTLLTNGKVKKLKN